jgi:hypothetical protein
VALLFCGEGLAGPWRLELEEDPLCDPEPYVFVPDGTEVGVSGDGRTFALLDRTPDGDHAELRIITLDGTLVRRFVPVKPGECKPPIKGKHRPVPARVVRRVKQANAFLQKGRYVSVPKLGLDGNNVVKVELDRGSHLLTVAYRGKPVFRRPVPPVRIKVASKAKGVGDCSLREPVEAEVWLWRNRLLVSVHFEQSHECHPNPRSVWLPPIALPAGD